MAMMQYNMAMNPTIWTHLPDDILDKVLALLPLHTILRLRPTCKRFHSLLLSPSFLSLHRSSFPSFLLLSHPQFSHRFLPLYSSSTALWRKAPLPKSPSPHLLSSSSSGLLLFSILPSPSLLIHNPLSSSSLVISTPLGSAAATAATIVSIASTRPHGYKIFLPSSSLNWVFVYESSTRLWTQFPGPDDGGKLVFGDGVEFGGCLYFTTVETLIVRFDLVTGRWDRNPLPGLPGALAFVRLVGGGNRLYLVGGIGNDGISRSLHVWEMVGEGWEEVGRLPEMMCRKFVSVCYHNYAHVYCLWHEGLVCVCCTTWPEVLLFKVVRKVWHWLPRCPLLQEKWSCGFRWFSFVPDLYALV